MKKTTKKYRTELQIGPSNEREIVEASFDLIKSVDCYTPENRDIMIQKLDRLKEEDFNRVLIPDFEYKVDGNVVTYNVDFIKGYGIGTFIPQFADVVYEDVVTRESDWSFADYHMVNFIVEYKTDKLYAIDFQSYGYLSNRKYREVRWKECREKDSTRLNEIMKGGWIKPRGW